MRTTAKHARRRKLMGCGLLCLAALFGLYACQRRESPADAPAVQPGTAGSAAAEAAKMSQSPSPDEHTSSSDKPETPATLPDSMLEESAQAAESSTEEPSKPRYDPQKAVPLVDHPDQLQRLHPSHPIWFDKQQRRVVIAGQVCGREVPLEMFACLRGTKEHEAVVVVDAPAKIAHAGLLAAGANPGNPVQFYPEYIPATGPEIDVTVVWEDEEGRRQRARAQDWIRNLETKQAMQDPWIFAGSQFTKDEQTGEVYYQADGGDFICVSNFPSAMLDIPIKSSDSNTALMFEGFAERIPPLGTPVTLILEPKKEQSKP